MKYAELVKMALAHQSGNLTRAMDIIRLGQIGTRAYLDAYRIYEGYAACLIDPELVLIGRGIVVEMDNADADRLVEYHRAGDLVKMSGPLIEVGVHPKLAIELTAFIDEYGY